MRGLAGRDSYLGWGAAEDGGTREVWEAEHGSGNTVDLGGGAAEDCGAEVAR